MNQEELHIHWNSLTDEQKKEAEEIFQEKRKQLFRWYEIEEEKVEEKLKKEGRFRKGLDANNNQPEVRKLSAEYHRRFSALFEESVHELFVSLFGESN